MVKPGEIAELEGEEGKPKKKREPGALIKAWEEREGEEEE